VILTLEISVGGLLPPRSPRVKAEPVCTSVDT
jgi:hypothetical protein